MKNILVPIGLKTDLTVYYRLEEILKISKSDILTLIHIIEVPFSTTLEAVNQLKATDKYSLSVKKLDSAENIFKSIGFNVKKRIEFGRDIVETIVDIATNENYDVIVLVKRRKVPRFLGKSVSRGVISRVNIPVLILTMD